MDWTRLNGPMYHIAPNFGGQNFRQNVENHVNINFRDKNVVISHGIFMIGCPITKFIKILLHKNLEVYGITKTSAHFDYFMDWTKQTSEKKPPKTLM